MFCVGGLNVFEELRDVSVVTEADEGLRIVPRHADVVALILTPELSVVLAVVGRAGVALDGHVAGGVVAVIVVEAYREVAVELLHSVPAHEALALPADKGAEVDVKFFAAGLHHDADLHRDKVEHPGGVAHLLRKVAVIFHVGASPDAFNVAWLRAERVFHELRADVRECFVWQHLNVLRIVTEEPEVRDVVP